MVEESRTANEQIMASIRETYGEMAAPDFRFVKRARERGQYSDLLLALGSQLSVDDLTDVNDDVGLHLALQHATKVWHLRISYVGPYYVLVRQSDGRPELVEAGSELNAYELEVVRTCTKHNLTRVPRQELEREVGLVLDKTDPECVRIYQALFTDTEWLPWEYLPS